MIFAWAGLPEVDGTEVTETFGEPRSITVPFLMILLMLGPIIFVPKRIGIGVFFVLFVGRLDKIFTSI